MKNRYLHTLLFNSIAAVTMGLALCGCADDDDAAGNGKGRPISFKIDLSQDIEGTRAANHNAHSAKPRNLQMKSTDGSTAYMQEVSREAIDDFVRLPMQKMHNEALVEKTLNGEQTPQTRGLLITDVASMSENGFSSWCYYDNGQLYYDNIQSDKNGNLTVDKTWQEGASLRFYAIHPFDANKVHFNGDYDALTYNFTVNTDVEKQEDLMYASTGVLPYNEEGLAPLHFQHALTAVQFAFGSNPNFNKTISSISIKGVHTTGTYLLPTEATKNDDYSLIEGQWTNIGSETTNITLSDLNIEATTEHANQIITATNQTFLLLPSDNLSGVSFEITFTDNTKLTYNFSENDKWFAGHTYTYKLSKQAEDYEYQLYIVGDYETGGKYTTTSSGTGTTMAGWASVYNMPYNESDLDWSGYGCLVKSIKYDSNNNIIPVPWEIVEYEYSMDDGETWISTGKKLPEWVEEFEGVGNGVSTSSGWEQVWPYFYPNVLTERETPEAAARTARITSKSTRGSSSDRFDLSTHNIKGTATSRNTANCYVISAPGYYKLPLVYGNAITNGATNTQAFAPTKPTEAEVRAELNYTGYEYVEDMEFMTNFFNYKGTAITNPWIETDGTPATAQLVWADRQALQSLLSSNLQVAQEGGHYYLYFDAADKTNVVQGNAVVAVKDADGNVMWSWHLWFAPDDVLETTTVTGHTGTRYNDIKEGDQGYVPVSYFQRQVANETLGYTLGYTYGTSYSEPRCIRAKVQQKEGNSNGPLTAYIRIRQFANTQEYQIHATLYQFGRKDAMPGIDYYFPSSTEQNMPTIATVSSYADAIKNPDKYIEGTNGNWISPDYSNAWSARYVSISTTYSDDVNPTIIKTVYDPCPAGYCLPTPRTFVDFGNIDRHLADQYDVDVSPNKTTGTWNRGYYFYTNDNKTSTIYFPAVGYRPGNVIGDNNVNGAKGYYHPALPEGGSAAFSLYFEDGKVQAYNRGWNKANACAVRPVKIQ